MKRMIFVLVSIFAAQLLNAQVCISQTQSSGPFNPNFYYTTSVTQAPVGDYAVRYMYWEATGITLPNRGCCNAGSDAYYISGTAIVDSSSSCSVGDTLRNVSIPAGCEMRYVVLITAPYGPCGPWSPLIIDEVDTNVVSRCGGPAIPSDTVLLVNVNEHYKVYVNQMLVIPSTVTLLQKEYRLVTRGNLIEVTIEDSVSGCSNSFQVIPSLQLTSVKQNVSCYGGSDGAVFLEASGGFPPYTFSLGGISNDSIFGLVAGTYVAQVTDALSSVTTSSIIIQQPQALIIQSVTSTVSTCSDGTRGTIRVQFQGGTPIYKTTLYDSLGNGIDSTATGGASNGAVFASLETGKYYIQLIDGKGCIDTASTTIGDGVPLQIFATARPNCSGANNGTVTVCLKGGVPSYSIVLSVAGTSTPVSMHSTSDTSTTLSFVAPNNYMAVVTDALGCTDTTFVILTIPNPLAIVETITRPRCAGGNDGKIEIQVQGGVPNYGVTLNELSSGNQIGNTVISSSQTAIFDSLASGNYRSTVVDSNGCTRSETITIPANSPWSIVLQVQDSIKCHGDSALVTVAYPMLNVVYAWSTGEVTKSVMLSAGNHTVSVTDTLTGCQQQKFLTVTEPDTFILNLVIDHPTCFSSQSGIEMDAEGGTPFSTYPVYGGVYNYTVREVATGNYVDNRYYYFHYSDLPSGTYIVVAQDKNLCEVADTVTINARPVVTLQVSMVPPQCGYDTLGTVRLVATGGNSPYSFSLGSTGVVVDSIHSVPQNWNGYYRAIDSAGCQVTSQTVTMPSAPPFPYSTIIHPTCSDIGNGSIVVTGLSSDYTVMWNDGGNETSRDSLLAGIYSFTISDSVCTYEEVVEVDSFPGLVVEIEVSEASCFGDAVTATVVAPLGQELASFLWTTGEETQSAHFTTQGQYKVIVTDIHGCEVILEGYAEIPDSLSVLVDTTGNIWSGYGRGGTPPYRYVWSTGENDSLIVKPQISGDYNLTVEDANGCIATWTGGMQISDVKEHDVLFIAVFPNPVIEKIFIEFSEWGNWQSELFDLAGKSVAKSEISGIAEIIDMYHMPSGTYILCVRNDKGKAGLKKIVKIEN